jgi:hypothetical protein
MARGESKTSPRRLAAMERQVRALKLRAEGLTFGEIALVAGFNSRQSAHKAVSLALARMSHWVTPDIVEIAVEAERVDALLVPTLRAAMAGDPLAIALALAAMDRRSQLLKHLTG